MNQGRFGEFVEQVIDADRKRQREEQEQEADRKLWMAYIRGHHEESYSEWKEHLIEKSDSRQSGSRDVDLTDSEKEDIIQNALAPWMVDR
ncbi:MAG: hypothetical protein IJ079_03915 [Lachnospiraceae bacterium]|nr:hypothetical protein [Lachnospiraceae bacterium]MBR1567555.1 hypothetical protein [Lachnospiraceae bacterium]MBR1568711.1 hypothetical protein [Lachnospiraceae bacterium]